MNILIVTGSYAPDTGGIAELVRGFAGGLAANGVVVHILAATPGASGFSLPSLPVSEFDLPKTGYLKRVRACRKATLGLVTDIQFDRIVASSWSPYAVDAPLRAGGRELSLDILCYGMDLLEPRRSPWYRLLMRRTLRRARLIIAISEFTASVARSAGAPDKRVVVMHPGVEPDRFVPGPRNAAILTRYEIAPDAPIVLSVGRLVERKGFDTVLQALPRILERYPFAIYLIVGDGPDRMRLERLASSLGVLDSIRFAGRVDEKELLGYYQTADVFVMPCREVLAGGDVEGFGIVFLEAACCKVPAVGGNSGGVADAVADGETGYLVEPHDPEELSAKLVTLLSDTNLRRSLGHAARERVLRNFQWPQLAQRYLESIR